MRIIRFYKTSVAAVLSTQEQGLNKISYINLLLVIENVICKAVNNVKVLLTRKRLSGNSQQYNYTCIHVFCGYLIMLLIYGRGEKIKLSLKPNVFWRAL